MILSGREIERNLGTRIVIDPFDRSRLNPNSYNLTLHNLLRVYRSNTLDMRVENLSDEVRIPEEGLLLEPHRLYLGRTVEYTATDGYVPMLEGRSSIGRLGLFVHITAGFGDVGFQGFWTLEIFCVQPIRIYAGVQIAQIFYHTIEGDYEKYASAKYQNNTGIQHSMLFKDFQKEERSGSRATRGR
ncbi:MAG: dCTP deaminase [Spirochaetota bacterium]